jgi:pimeloyl-ACP methyl ester carboxylesterase
MQIVFVGGWGFTETHYQPFLSGLKESLAEEGYIQHIENMSCVSFPCKRESTLPTPFIGIGHSLGVASLLKHYAQNLKALINISGFPCFVKTPQQPYGASPKILRAMQQKFDTHPERILQDFYQNCGVADAPLPDAKHYPSFAESLEMLGDTTFFTPPPCPTLSLHSVEDAIVSVSNTKHFTAETVLSTSSNPFIGMSGEKEFFEETQAYSSVRADSEKKSDDANRPRKEVNRRALLYDGGSHALPLTHTTQIIQDITAFLKRLI